MISDYGIYQNNLIGAHAIWEFAKYYEEYHPERQSPVFLLTLPVLPIVFNRRATDQIKSRFFKEGSLFKTITENKDIYSGLQQRMEQTFDLTLKSIYLASAARLVLFDKDNSQVIANYSTEINIKLHRDYGDIIACSRRIGAWFGQLNLNEIQDYFNIKF